MTLSLIQNPYAQIANLVGLGNTGYVYIGEPNEDPQTNPQAVWWDAAGTVPASQPLTMVGGYIMRSGAPAQAFTARPFSMQATTAAGVQIFLEPEEGATDAAADKLNVTLDNVSATGDEKSDFRAAVYDDYSTMIPPGVVGDNITDDTAALQAALDTGNNITLPIDWTCKITGDLTMENNWQRFGGTGVLAPRGACGVLVTNGAIGAQLDLSFDSPDHTGWAVRIDNADRTRIVRLYGKDIYSAVYVRKANTTLLDYVWAECRGAGVKYWGDDTHRSDILYLGMVLLGMQTSTEYGFDWNGNAHSVIMKYMGLVCGTGDGPGQRVCPGAIIRNTTGGATAPQIGRFEHLEIDYSGDHGLNVQTVVDLDIAQPYILGADESGIYVGATVNNGEVRITGGKSRGCDRYGIENAGGQVYFAGNTDLQDNDLGATLGTVLTRSPQIGPTYDYHMRMSSGNPVLNFDPTDYLSYDTVANTLSAVIGGVLVWSVSASVLTIPGGAGLATTVTALTNGAASATATLTNAPAAGNPTKWISINDAGTVRRIPAW